MCHLTEISALNAFSVMYEGNVLNRPITAGYFDVICPK